MFARRLMAQRATQRFASAHDAQLALDCIAAAPCVVVAAPCDVETTARFQR
jgi:hypothetical protein